MARIELEAMDEAERVYVAVSLAEARRVEDLLTIKGVNYAVEVETFSTTLFGTPRHGAVFYVAIGQAAYCRSQLTVVGLEGVLGDDPPT